MLQGKFSYFRIVQREPCRAPPPFQIYRLRDVYNPFASTPSSRCRVHTFSKRHRVSNRYGRGRVGCAVSIRNYIYRGDRDVSIAVGSTVTRARRSDASLESGQVVTGRGIDSTLTTVHRQCQRALSRAIGRVPVWVRRRGACVYVRACARVLSEVET